MNQVTDAYRTQAIVLEDKTKQPKPKWRVVKKTNKDYLFRERNLRP